MVKTLLSTLRIWVYVARQTSRRELYLSAETLTFVRKLTLLVLSNIVLRSWKVRSYSRTVTVEGGVKI